MNTKEIAEEIINQLGGKSFLFFTGTTGVVYQGFSPTNKNISVCMNLAKNKTPINRLKIILELNDTYTMKFYRQVIKNYVDVVISHEQTFENIYCDELQETFTEVTGLYTRL